VIQGLLHSHITAWLIAFVLFFVVIGLNSRGKQKGSKIVSMILRSFYILILLTGTMLLVNYANITTLLILKAAVGVWVIGALEMILMKSKKKELKIGSWFQLIVAFSLVLYLGLSLSL
jgi:hypothetical protein